MTEFELHAYIDGELAEEERAMVLDALTSSHEARTRLETLQRLKTLIRSSYMSTESTRFENNDERQCEKG